MTQTTTTENQLDGETIELLFTFDLVVSELLPHASQNPRDDTPRGAIARAVNIAESQLVDYHDEPTEMRDLRYALREKGYDMLYPMLKGQTDYYVSSTSAEEMTFIKPLLKALREADNGLDFRVMPSTDSDSDGIPYMDVEVFRWTEENDYDAARELLGALKAGDDWTVQHDHACLLLGGDPDDYRAADNENWHAGQRGKVTFELGVDIVNHLNGVPYPDLIKAREQDA